MANSKAKMLHVELDPRLHQLLRIAAAKADQTITAYVRELLTKTLKPS